MRIPPRRLLFSGGGVRAVAFAGCLEELEANHILQHVKEFCGVSAGSFIALMLAIGYSVEIIKKLCLEFNFSEIPEIEPESILSVYDQLGLDTGERLEKLVKSILKHRGMSPEITFAELARVAKPVRAWATDAQSLTLIETSATATPNLPVWFGIRASMAFPFYFTPIKHPETGHLLIDGGVLDNCPMRVLTELEQRETWGIVFDADTQEKDINTIVDLIKQTFAGLRHSHTKQFYETFQDSLVCIPCMDFPALHFQATVEERCAIMKKARDATRAFLQTSSKKSYRRHSVC